MTVMVRSCAAFNCKSRWRKGSDISFHFFPLKKPELLQKWIVATKRKNFIPTKSTSLCSKHFNRYDYIEPLFTLPSEKRNLKNDAVPSIFYFPSNMQHPVPKKRRTINRNEPLNSKEQDKQLSQAQNAESSTNPAVMDTISQSVGINSPVERVRSIDVRCSLKSPTKTILRQKVKVLQQRLQRRDNRIKSMRDLIYVLKEKLNAPDTLESFHTTWTATQ